MSTEQSLSETDGHALLHVSAHLTTVADELNSITFEDNPPLDFCLSRLKADTESARRMIRSILSRYAITTIREDGPRQIVISCGNTSRENMVADTEPFASDPA